MSEAEIEARYPLFSKLQPLMAPNGEIYEGPVIGTAMAYDTAVVNRYLSMPQVKAMMPRDIKLMWGIKAIDPAETQFQLYAIKANTRDGKAPLERRCGYRSP